MVHELKRLGRTRYVGDSRTRVVHDRWHPDCQGCSVRGLVRDGHAVAFEPDTLDSALWAGYEYCEACFDGSDPEPPGWAKGGGEESEDKRRGGYGSASGATPQRGREAGRSSAPASERETLEIAR